MADKCILLTSALASNAVVEVNQRRLEDYITSNKYSHEKIDGSNPDNKPARDELFGISG